MTGTVARDGAQFEITNFQRRDPWAEMVISDRFADVELIDPHAMYFVSFHRHGLTSPSRRNLGPCHLSGQQTSCVEDDRERRRTTPVRRTQPEKVRITHPFHPVSGHEFEALATKNTAVNRESVYNGSRRLACLSPPWEQFTEKGTFQAVRFHLSG
jgi:hypothetical protein